MPEHFLERVLQNRASLVTAHRLSTIASADEIIVLDRVRIAERGTQLAASGCWRALFCM
jgi:ABC-type transport system involved in Fe-S cluster assembly fused permease/ATPase subunit